MAECSAAHLAEYLVVWTEEHLAVSLVGTMVVNLVEWKAGCSVEQKALLMAGRRADCSVVLKAVWTAAVKAERLAVK